MKLKTEKKKTESLKKKVEQKKKEKEAQFEKEASKVDNFVDEAFHEAFETLNIYQKCMQDEQKKWIKQRKNMNPNNTAAIVRSLRKIFNITKQNMDLLDTTLVQGRDSNWFLLEWNGNYTGDLDVIHAVLKKV